MSSSSNSSYTQSSNRLWSKCRQHGGKKCGNWSGINITAMIIGFVVFWPVGLLIMFSNMSGRDVKDLPQEIRGKWSSLTANWSRNESFSRSDYSDNDVFNEYQQTQYDRIHEIKEEIKARSRSFREFRENLRRRANEDEFNRFMSGNPASTDV